MSVVINLKCILNSYSLAFSFPFTPTLWFLCVYVVILSYIRREEKREKLAMAGFLHYLEVLTVLFCEVV